MHPRTTVHILYLPLAGLLHAMVQEVLMIRMKGTLSQQSSIAALLSISYRRMGQSTALLPQPGLAMPLPKPATLLALKE